MVGQSPPLPLTTVINQPLATSMSQVQPSSPILATFDYRFQPLANQPLAKSSLTTFQQITNQLLTIIFSDIVAEKFLYSNSDINKNTFSI